jgi:hypothetical protein
MTTTLTCETGQQSPSANSYASLDYANTYLANNTDWTGLSDSDKTDALATAFQSLELLYGPLYIGQMYPRSLQTALWPRIPVSDNFGRLILAFNVPDCLLKAQCEIAVLFVNGVNVFPVKATKANVAEQSVSMDGLRSSVKYVKPVEDETFPGFRKVDLILAAVLKGKGGVSYRMGL